MIEEFNGIRPKIHSTVYLHETCVVTGRVQLKSHVSLWPGVVLRGDVEKIVVGEGTNIQDGTIVHTDHHKPTILGRGITVGHAAVLHGCRLSDHCLVGMGAILLNDVVVEKESIVAAGALVPPGMRIPRRRLVMGSPARVVRALKPTELKKIFKSARFYIQCARKHQQTSRPVFRA